MGAGRGSLLLMFGMWLLTGLVSLSGMFHMFLLIKDGFFHITHLDLANITTGMEVLHRYLMDICTCLCVCNLSAIPAIERMDIGALKDVRLFGFFSCREHQKYFSF